MENEKPSEADLLLINPVDGTLGTVTDINGFGDKFVTCRKDAKCCQCSKEIKKGERARVMNGLFDGDLEITNRRWCVPCLEAMHSENKG